MPTKKKMFESMEQLRVNILKIQDIVIELRRESEELHVAAEHEIKLSNMKCQLQMVHVKLESMQDFVDSCQRRVEHPQVFQNVQSEVWL